MFISREITETLSEEITNRHVMNFEIELPEQRFFIPKPEFWEYLKQIMEENGLQLLVDCGAGDGDLMEEARDHGIKMGGCDIYRRKRSTPHGSVQMMPAHMFPFADIMWPIVCRPDHSGWARALIEKMEDDKRGFIYVGLEYNMSVDLEHYEEQAIHRFENIGEDGEHMLIFNFGDES